MASRLVSRNWKSIAVAVVSGITLIVTVWVGPLSAQGGRVETFVSPPVTVEKGGTALVRFTNVGRRPVRVTIQFRDAEDEEAKPLETATFFKVPGGGAFEDITSSIGLGVIAHVRVEGRSAVRMSLEVKDVFGQTQVFTDGFETGDTSR